MLVLEPTTAMQVTQAVPVGAHLTSDGQFIVAGSSNTEVMYISTDGFEDIKTIEHRGIVAVPSSDGRLLATSIDERVMLTEFESGSFLTQFDGHNHAALSLAFSPDGKVLLSGGKRELFLHSTEGGPSRFVSDIDLMDEIVFVDATRFVTAGASGALYVWSLETLKCLARVPAHDARVRALAFLPERGLLASGADDGTLRFWQVTGDNLVALRAERNFGRIASIAFTHDGSGLLIAFDLNALAVIRLSDGERKGRRFAGDDLGMFAMGPFVTLLSAPGKAATLDARGVATEWDYRV